MAMRETSNGNDNHVHYDTFADLLDAFERSEHGYSWSPDSVSFSTGPLDTLNTARTGWKAGAERVQALVDKLVSKVMGETSNTGLEYRDDGGPLLDVGRFCEGEPEHYLEFAPAPTRKPVTITANLFITAATQGAYCERRGAALLAAASILRAKGYAVEIQGLFYVRDYGSGRLAVTFPIQRAGEVMDGDAMAFTCAHAGMVRHVLFCGLQKSKLARNFGFTPSGYCGKYAGHEPTREQGAGDVHVASIHADSGPWASEAAAEMAVLEICKQAGCEIAEV